ncbi:MAG TPA: hypothetical protein VFV99_24690 [Kofleriaceae bacterium]|nr:hypothetical protein [Kofleriaceae bacterium]
MQKLQLCAVALALAACASDTDDPSNEPRRGKGPHTPEPTVDAALTPPPPSDPVGTVSCYTEGAPQAACTLPTHCCFGNYSAQHNGYCTTEACAESTIACDGPEDCANGQHCCATLLDIGRWNLACQSSACSPQPLGDELCHDSSTCGGGTCVSALDANYDLPRTLSVCR